MNLKQYVLNVVGAFVVSILGSMLTGQGFSFQSSNFVGALLGVFMYDYWKAGRG